MKMKVKQWNRLMNSDDFFFRRRADKGGGGDLQKTNQGCELLPRLLNTIVC